MRKYIIGFLLFFLGNNPVLSKELMLNLQYHKNKEAFDLEKLTKGLSDVEIDTKTYVIDDNSSIEEHVNKIREFIRQYCEKEKKLQVLVLTDRESTFVGLELASVDTPVKALFTFSGAFNDGDNFLYGEMSFKKNMEMLDSISLDRSKERYLEKVLKMIADKKKGKKIRLPKNADSDMTALYALLQSNYWNSVLGFSLDDHLHSIKAEFLPIMPYVKKKNLMTDVDYLNLCHCGNKYQIRYSYPIFNDGDRLVAEILKHVSELKTK